MRKFCFKDAKLLLHRCESSASNMRKLCFKDAKLLLQFSKFLLLLFHWPSYQYFNDNRFLFHSWSNNPFGIIYNLLLTHDIPFYSVTVTKIERLKDASHFFPIQFDSILLFIEKELEVDVKDSRVGMEVNCLRFSELRRLDAQF